MAQPGKSTIAIDTDEFAILDAIRRYAPEFRIDSVRAETYAIWTICFRRYCVQTGIPWQWMDSVSYFMNFLQARADVSAAERNRALDGIMFYLNDVRHAKDEDDAEAVRQSAHPQSTRSLFAQLLLRCDIRISEALRLRLSNVQMAESKLNVPRSTSQRGGPETVELPPSLRRSLQRHVRRLRAQTSENDPLLFDQNREPTPRASRDAATAPSDLKRSAELATLVMNTLSQTPSVQPGRPDASDDADVTEPSGDAENRRGRRPESHRKGDDE